MSLIFQWLNRSGRGLSTLAFLVAGGAAALAVTDPCYVSNGGTWCCYATGIDCTSEEGDLWTCISSGVGGPISVSRVKAAPVGVTGQMFMATSSSTCIYTTRACGTQINSCVNVSTVVMTCTSNVPSGPECVGVAPN